MRACERANASEWKRGVRALFVVNVLCIMVLYVMRCVQCWCQKLFLFLFFYLLPLYFVRYRYGYWYCSILEVFLLLLFSCIVHFLLTLAVFSIGIHNSIHTIPKYTCILRQRHWQGLCTCMMEGGLVIIGQLHPVPGTSRLNDDGVPS